MTVPEPAVSVHEAVGVIHVHSTRSDGCTEPGPILDLADQAGLDYLCFNDHNTLALAEEGWHGRRHGGVLSIVGAEIQHTDRKSHLLVFGASELHPRGHILSQLERVKADGALAVAAHPREVRPRIPFFEEYPWLHGAHSLLDGVEIWNWMSQWKGGVTLSSLPRRMRYPDQYVRNPNRKAVDLWFDVGGCALAGADAHGHTILLRKVFPYDFLFNRVRTHLLLNEPLSEPTQLDKALGKGNCFTSNALAGDARGFRARRVGETLQVELPGDGWISIFTPANPPAHSAMLPAGSHEFSISPGPVHIEVYRTGRTWITCSLDGKER